MRKDFSILSKIRIAFWEEYERAARVPEPLKGNGLWRSVCRADQYYPFFSKYKSLLPWVVCPLSGYLMQRKELEFLAEERMIEILSVSPVKEDGKVDSRLAKVQVEIYQTIQDRVYGPVIQKIQTEGKNVNVNVNSDQTTEEARRTIGLITNVEEIDRRIQALREKSIALKTISHQPIEVNTQKLMRPDLVNTHNNEDQE